MSEREETLRSGTGPPPEGGEPVVSAPEVKEPVGDEPRSRSPLRTSPL